jgi:tripartite-type tricarboxylate transporter receptor subunit TctC
MRVSLGQLIVIDNRVGAGGAIGTAAGARAEPDGYTITMIGSPAVLAMETMLQPGFDLAQDFAPVGRLNDLVNMFVVSRKLPVTSIKELVAYAKANPGKLNFASSGPATPTDLGIQLFAKKQGIDIALVPYKTSPAAVMSVVSGETDASVLQAGAVLPHIKSGAMRALAVAGPSRWPVLPDVPTADETDARVYVNGFIGLMVPKGTPADRIAVLNKALNEAVAHDNVKQLAINTGGSVLPGTPEQFTDLIKLDWASVREAVTSSGLKKQ